MEYTPVSGAEIEYSGTVVVFIQLDCGQERWKRKCGKIKEGVVDRRAVLALGIPLYIFLQSTLSWAKKVNI